MLLNLLYAIRTATLAHDGQRRKWTNEPYIIHPLRVMSAVAKYIESPSVAVKDNEQMLIIAVLHDVLEDTDYPEERMEEEFGVEVKEGVLWLTNSSKKHKDKPRAERKKMDREHIAQAPDHIKVIKLLDRLDNLLDMRKVDEKGRNFLEKVYVPETNLLLEVIGGVDPKLKHEVQKAADIALGKSDGPRELI